MSTTHHVDVQDTGDADDWGQPSVKVPVPPCVVWPEQRKVLRGRRGRGGHPGWEEAAAMRRACVKPNLDPGALMGAPIRENLGASAGPFHVIGEGSWFLAWQRQRSATCTPCSLSPLSQRDVFYASFIPHRAFLARSSSHRRSETEA